MRARDLRGCPPAGNAIKGKFHEDSLPVRDSDFGLAAFAAGNGCGGDSDNDFAGAGGTVAGSDAGGGSGGTAGGSSGAGGSTGRVAAPGPAAATGQRGLGRGRRSMRAVERSLHAPRSV